MTDEEFVQIVTLGHELSGVEFKGPGPLTDSGLTAQVVRAMIGMANRRDGGNVIIGVSEQDNSLNPIGINGDELSTWSYDNLADQVARYADPSITFELEIKEYNLNQFVVLAVEEFDDIPVLCKRAHSSVLRDGACYVRTRRKPETSELPTQTEMRDLLSLATEKGVRRYIEQLERLGIIALPSVTLQTEDENSFNQELGESR